MDGRNTAACDRYNCANCLERARCAQAACAWDARLAACQPVEHAGHGFRGTAFVPTSLQIADEQLDFVHGGHSYARAISVPGWNDAATAQAWVLVFGARTTLNVDDHWVRDVNMQQGALVGNGTAAVRLHNASESACSAAAGLTFEYATLAREATPRPARWTRTLNLPHGI
eukprot:2491720-Prymnesium_polylepis.2